MIAALLYSILGLLLTAGVVFMLLPKRHRPAAITENECECAEPLGAGESFTLAERLFDPSDYWWLRDEVRLPALAESLRRSRQQMALAWLRGLRRSFDQLLKTPDPAGSESGRSDSWGSWRLLRLALRFHLVLGYACFVVRFLGPYHNLVPSCGWMQPAAPSRVVPETLGPVHSRRGL
jgi:hypothetical protein